MILMFRHGTGKLKEFTCEVAFSKWANFLTDCIPMQTMSRSSQTLPLEIERTIGRKKE